MENAKRPIEKAAAARQPKERKILVPAAVPVTWPRKICYGYEQIVNIPVRNEDENQPK